MDPDETHDDFNEEHSDMNTIHREVRNDIEHALYVITTYPGGGVSTYGWDHVLEQVERLTLGFGETDVPSLARGSREALDTMLALMERARVEFEETGEPNVGNLTPGLSGLEGWRVEVIDEADDEPRRFIVGRSTGWIPVHLELHNTRSRGGSPARPDGYYEVREIERVW